MVTTAAFALLMTLVGVPAARGATGVNSPVAVTPYSGFKPTLTRAPYVTDLTQTTAYVNWATSSSTPGSILVQPAPGGACPSSIATWTPAAIKVPTSLPGPVNPTSSGSSAAMTGWAFAVVNGAGTTIHEYQASVELTGLSAGTQYCDAVFSTDTPAAVALLPPSQSYQLMTTLDAASTSSTKPLTFDVIADTGENYSYTTANGSGAIPFPSYVNPDQAAIYHLIGSSGAKFVLNAGDIGYAGGTQSTYGDLQQTGTNSEVSNVFGPSYYPQTKGIPTFAADGNHGQNVTTLRNWPTPETAARSGGTYAFDSYSGVDGITGTYPDNWYAFSTGNVRIYMLDASWSDGSSGPLGNTTGSLCAIPSYCKGYQADADEHWQTSSPEYRWLTRDLAANPGGVKLAVFHYPLRSDNATQPGDPYLLNSTANPKAASSLEKLLADNGVGIAFNGHAHTYQRIVPTQSGQIINYVTGGAGAVLEPVLGGSNCAALQRTASVYAVGWTPSHTDPSAGTGSACGAIKPLSAADVYHFLKVTVSGNKVTVTPTDAAGATFDTQTYTVPSGGGGGGRTVTVAASDDATVSKLAANGSTKYGLLTTVTVDADQNSNDLLMRFTVPAGCTPSAASLTVTTSGGSTSGSAHGGSFYAAPGSWDESTVTAANAPAAVGTPVSLGSVATGTSYTLNVTSLLPAGVTAGSTVSLRATTTSADAAVYVSRNAGNGSTAGPKLTLTC